MHKSEKKQPETRGEKVVFAIRRTVDWIFIVFFLLILLFCLYAIYDSALVYEEASNTGRIKEFVIEDEGKSKKIDFEHLQEVNSDVIGWIELEGTNISQPIMHGEDNNYYLSHNFEKKYSNSGGIFTDSMKSRDWSDAYTLIYGHNMNGDLMFGHLHRYHEPAFFAEHTTGVLYTPKGDYDLRVEAELVVNKDTPQIYSVIQSKTDAKIFLDYVDANANQKRALDPTRKYLALSTCQGQTNMREVVVLSYNPKEKK